jgi:NodT family efflux transporter outer membrane factor (OMF) lipoprotein
VGPRYQRPPAATPVAWKTAPPWQAAAPKDSIPKGKWWAIFQDHQLDAYEQQLLQANQSLEAARQRLEEARSLARVASAGYFPQLTTDPLAARQRLSANRPAVATVAPTRPVTQNNFEIPFSLNYEVDLFGRVRHTLEAANASLQANAANLENTQLVLTAELAADYITIHEIDSEIDVVRQAIEYQQKGLELVQNRHNAGIASGLEVAQQATVLDSTTSQLHLLQQQRDQFEHAIAVLVGTPASGFSIPATPLQAKLPSIPLGVPSDVLERRPDVAAAERSMAEQNARVGIATAAFYPHISLTGSGGFQSRDISSLATAPSAFWAVGSDLLEPVLNGGRNRANLTATKSAYNASVADYRQSVLVAFQQVEDGLSSLNALSQALTSQNAAVQDARRTLELANNRYVGGVTSYLDVITAQTTLLSNERLATQLLGQQMVTSVFLVKALGGGWDSSELQNQQVHPSAGQVLQQ